MMVNSIMDVILIIILTPFIGVGIYQFIKYIVELILIQRFGFIKIKFFTKNFRMIEKLVKPKDGKISINGVEIPFNNSPGYIYLNLNTPYAFYREGELNQINISELDKSNVDPKMFSKLCIDYFETGRLSALKKNNMNDMIFIAIIILILISVVGLGSIYFKLQNLDKISEALTKLVS